MDDYDADANCDIDSFGSSWKTRSLPIKNEPETVSKNTFGKTFGYVPSPVPMALHLLRQTLPLKELRVESV